MPVSLVRRSCRPTTAPITADSCNTNGVIDPNETVTVNFGIKNTGLVSTTNLVATLQTSGGVTNPSGPQTYGAIASGGGTAVKSFTFTAGGVTCGSVVTATLQLQDGATNFGTITYNFQIGTQTVALSESFDAVSAPALPSGWTATNVVGGPPLWATSTTVPDTAPNEVSVADPPTVSDKVLTTPSINITSTAAQVTFRHEYDFENSYDGGVLEVSSPNINGGMFTDITNPGVGGSFVDGGYNSTISPLYDNPLAGRPAWSGTLFGYSTVTANLGPNVAGHAIKLRFRLGSDTGTSGGGWRIDGVKVSNGYQCCGLLMTASGPAVLTAEGFAPADGAPDPGEPVTVNLPLSNVGTVNSSNLVATLQATGGVTSPSAPQNYGAVVAAGPSVSRSFTFTAAGNCGDNITLTLALQDGATNLGTATFTMRLGTRNTLFSEAFDGVSAPALPAGWTTAVSGAESAWVTSITTPSNAPNDAFAPDATNIGNTELITPTIAVPAGGGQLTFRNLFNMEGDATSGYDGMVLEISINGGAFADITNGGNAFTTGGYTRTIASIYGSPIAGRPAWSGLSGGTTAAPAYITSTINLPAAAAGQNIKLKWRAATDNSAAAAGAAGVRIDDIKITGVANVCIGTQAPAITNGPPPSLAVVGTPYNFAFTATGNPAPTFSLKDGTLPPGLNLSSAGVLSGNTSGGTGSYPNITVAATNGIMPDVSQTFSMTTATTSGNYLASFGLTGGNAALLFDYDGDGIANLLEYALGLNPTINSQSGLPVVTLKDYSGTKYLSMTFNRSSLATDLTYNVQVSGDLGSWTTVGSSTGGGVTTGLGFVGEIGGIPAGASFSVEVRDIVPFNPDVKRFIRLQVTTP